MSAFGSLDSGGSSSHKLAQSVDRLTDLLRQRRATGQTLHTMGAQPEPLAETPYGKAIQRIRQGMNLKQDALRGEFDKDIRAVFINYLSTKYHGATGEEIKDHARNGFLGFQQRARSWFTTTAGNMMGTAVSGLFATVTPKLSVFAGLNAAGGLTSLTGLTIGSAFIPAAVAAFSVASVYGATRFMRLATHHGRDARKAGNILRDAMNDTTKLRKLRTAVANGTDIFKEFDDLIRERSGGFLGKHSEKLWTLGMLATAGTIGVVGSGSIDRAMEIGKSLGNPNDSAFYATLRAIFENPAALANQFWEKFPHIGQGMAEWKDFLKYFWEHAVATTGLGEMPDRQAYIRRFFHEP